MTGSRRRARRDIAALTIVVSILTCPTSRVFAQTRTAPLTEVYHRAWGLRDGLPGSVSGITQTEDGFLWLVTSSGLARFDGSRFERQPETRKYSRIARIAAAPGGGLWIVHDGRIVTLLKDGRVTDFDEGLPDDRIQDLSVAPDGVLWSLTSRALLRLLNGRWETLAADWNVPTGLWALSADRRGTVWLASQHGVLALRTGERR